MKYSILILQIFAFFLFSCEGEKVICDGELKSKPIDHISHCIDGKWKYLLRSGGFLGKTEEVNDREILFDTGKKKIQIFYKSNIELDVTYSWLENEDIFNETANMITYFAGSPKVLIIDGIYSDTLLIRENAEDGYDYFLKRIN